MEKNMKISRYILIALPGLFLAALPAAQAQSTNSGTKPMKIEDIDPAMKGKKAEEGGRRNPLDRLQNAYC
jgi:hypothetical protein